jgi:hypothetical protein
MVEAEHVFLIGAMKSGTTTLHEYLIQHPEICPCISKEPEYFSKKMGNPKLKEGKYEDLFPWNDSNHRFTLDASTG